MLKKLLIAVVLCCVCLPFQADAAIATKTKAVSKSTTSNKITLRSRISEVTVFSDRALIVRKASVTLSPGEKKLSFGRLPGQTDVDSVQVKGQGRAMIKGVDISTKHTAELADADLKRLTQKKKNINDQILVVKDGIGQAKKEKEFVESIAKKLTTATDKGSQAELNPEKWIDMVAFYRKKNTALDKEIRNKNKELPVLKEKLQKLNREIQELQRSYQRSKYEITVLVKVKAAGKVDLELSYVVYGPRWYPKYDVRADSKKATVNLSYQAMIVQNTSEDWKRAKLILSTAKPRAGSQHAKLGPWRVNVYKPRPAPRRSSRSRKKQAMRSMAKEAPSVAMDEMLMSAPPPAPEMEVQQATVESQATAVVFNMQGKQTIPSDNQPHQVTVLIKSFPAQFQYSTVPKMVPNAYLKATITNETQFPLLAGKTNIFLDDNFVANGQLDNVPPSKKFEAFLGIDEGIEVEHKMINRKEEGAGVFGGHTKIQYDYLIKITNHKKQTHKITVWDQFPISGHGDIKVELKDPKLKDGEKLVKKDNQNILEWNYEIKGGASIEIPVRFNVSYPNKIQVQGL
jgi:uncharacterized protein (TIGR02231 family)